MLKNPTLHKTEGPPKAGRFFKALGRDESRPYTAECAAASLALAMTQDTGIFKARKFISFEKDGKGKEGLPPDGGRASSPHEIL